MPRCYMWLEASVVSNGKTQMLDKFASVKPSLGQKR